MKQRLNKVRSKARDKASRTYKEQECLAILAIARTCGLWLHPHATRNEGAYLGKFCSSAFYLPKQSAESALQDKHFNYNSTYTHNTTIKENNHERQQQH